MTVATFTQPNFTTQLGNSYKGNIDGGFSVFSRIAGAFAPHEQSTPNMTVRVDAGYVFSGSVLTEVAAQNSATIVAPTTNPRIDRIVVDAVTGAVSVVTGVQGASPVAPAIPSGKVPVAQVLLQTTSTVINNSMLTDERSPVGSVTYTETSITPTITTGGGSITLNSNSRVHFTKIGRMVSFTGRILVSSVSSPSGLCYVQGFPFTPLAGTDGGYGAVSVYADNLLTSSITAILADVNPLNSFMGLWGYQNGAIQNIANLVQAGTEFKFSGNYCT